MDGNELEILIQGGAVGLALVAFAMVFYTLRALLNHLPHISETLRDLVAEVRAMRSERDGQ